LLSRSPRLAHAPRARAGRRFRAQVSDLIHCSEQHRELPYARVVVHFADIYDLEGSAYEVVPGSELEVSRVAYRDSSSKYFVDGKASNFTEVTALCKARGVDLDHNRFLILQGEVEQIAMMKPKAPSPHEDGLLEYLEDLIGSNRHIEPINERTAAVDALTEQRGSMLNRLKAVEREKDALEGSKDEAVAFVRGEHELACKRGTLYQVSAAAPLARARPRGRPPLLPPAAPRACLPCAARARAFQLPSDGLGSLRQPSARLRRAAHLRRPHARGGRARGAGLSV
jgi:structural maintenance of chromosome 4